MKRGDTMATDKELNILLIEEYQRLMRIRQLAVKANAEEVIKEIDKEVTYLKLKLQPLELPKD